MKITVKDPKELKYHRLADQHRDMSSQEYHALLRGIETAGQQVPIILYKGKIVDGRHRQKALIELGISTITCTELPGNMTLNAVRDIILETENRRTDSPGQKAIRAYRWSVLQEGRSLKDAAEKFGLALPRVSEAKRFQREMGIVKFNSFSDDGYLMIGDKKYTSIKGIVDLFGEKK